MTVQLDDFLLIQQLLSVRDEVSRALVDLGWDSLQNSEWKTLEQIHFLLEPFARYTQLTSGEEFTTLSTVIPVHMELDYHLEAVSFLYLELLLSVCTVWSTCIHFLLLAMFVCNHCTACWLTVY